MFTEEQEKIEIIYSKVNDAKAKLLFYQIMINYTIYKDITKEININMKNLISFDFARTQTCHLTDGIFGEQKYIEYQSVYKLKVIGNLITLITSAHRIITCIKDCRKIEKSDDWKDLKESITICEKKYDNKLRNFMEHLDEKVAKQELTNENCYFTPQKLLYCCDETAKIVFDFNEKSLNMLSELIRDLFDMLSRRIK